MVDVVEVQQPFISKRGTRLDHVLFIPSYSDRVSLELETRSLTHDCLRLPPRRLLSCP
jgi:hypothetical protein